MTEIAARPDGTRFVFARGGILFDGLVARIDASGYSFLLGGENYQASTSAIASGLNGDLLIVGDGHPNPDNDYGIVELQRREQPANTVVTSFDADFGIAAVGVAPLRACSNGYDDDGDGLVDWDGGGLGAPDTGCAGNPMRNDEKVSQGGCGLGAELVVLGAGLFAAKRRKPAPRR